IEAVGQLSVTRKFPSDPPEQPETKQHASSFDCERSVASTLPRRDVALQILAEHSLKNRCDSCLSRYPQNPEYRACGKTLNNEGEKDEAEDQAQNFVMTGDRCRDAEGQRQRQGAPQPGPDQPQTP